MSEAKFSPLLSLARHAQRRRMEMQCDPQWVLDLSAERDALRAEVERLQTINYRQEQQIATLTADPNGWQAGYNKGRHDGTKTRLSELEQERRINLELRDQLREQREDYAVGAALQRAAGELPEGFEIRVEVERGAGTARLYGPNGDEIEGIEGDGLADEINEAIDTAMEAPR